MPRSSQALFSLDPISWSTLLVETLCPHSLLSLCSTHCYQLGESGVFILSSLAPYLCMLSTSNLFSILAPLYVFEIPCCNWIISISLQKLQKGSAWSGSTRTDTWLPGVRYWGPRGTAVEVFERDLMWIIRQPQCEGSTCRAEL